MKRGLLVSAYFTPSNLAGVLRARLVASQLREFGWEMTVVCVDSSQYEEANDEASLALVPEDLQVERVGAWPAKVCRPLGFGDIALRAQWSMRRRVKEILSREKVDLIFCTVLPGYTMLVGAWAKKKINIPFVLDYQDPWVTDLGARRSRFSKAGLAHWLATRLEPGAVKKVDAFTAVSEGTLDTLRKRQLIRKGVPVEIIPIGADENDHIVAAQAGRSWVHREVDECVLAYVGTITERMLPALRTLLQAVKKFNEGSQDNIKVHLIGTSAQPHGTDTQGIGRMIKDLGLDSCVRLEPRRVPYLDALRTMQDANILLLLGSTDAHYTASKIFPCWLAKKPILGIFHSGSTVNQLARELGGISLVTYDENHPPESMVDEVVTSLKKIIVERSPEMSHRKESVFEPYSARRIAQQYARLFDRVLAVGN